MMEQALLTKILQHKSPTGDAIDVVKLANTLGMEVYAIQEPSEFNSQLMYQADTNAFTIQVNSAHPINRQRFSIAHEIAHFIKHAPIVKERQSIDRAKVFFTADKKLEDEANKLAAEILMPKELVVGSLKKTATAQSFITAETLKQVAEKFKVSVAVALLRLRDLGYKVEYVSFA